MRRSLLDLLACPDCKASLTLEEEGPEGGGVEGGADETATGTDEIIAGTDEIGAGADEVVTRADEIVTGTLRCSECGFGYPVEAGIPNLLPQAFHRDEVQD